MLARFFPPKKEEKIMNSPVLKAPLDHQFLCDLASLTTLTYNPQTLIKDIPPPWIHQTSFDPVLWERSEHQSACGYMGKIFYLSSGEPYNIPTAIVIVHRGTIMENVDNLIGDLKIVMNKVPAQVAVAAKWVDQQLDRLNQYVYRYSRSDVVNNIPIFHVGHSLGAVIANCLYARKAVNHNTTHPGRIHTIGFENPGTRKIVKNYLMNSYSMSEEEALQRMKVLDPYIHNYQADVNIINTCNSQWGEVNHVNIPYRYRFIGTQLPIPTDLIASSYLLNDYYLKTYTIYDQHEMANLEDHLKKGAQIADASERKHGFVSGYMQYLDGNKRKDYWLGFCNEVWEHEGTIRKIHKEYDSFVNFIFKKLSNLRGPQALLNEKMIIEQEVFNYQTNNLFSFHSPKKPMTEFVSDGEKLHEFELVDDEDKKESENRFVLS